MNNSNKLERLSDLSSSLLFSCRTVFPFTLFPDTITVDKIKVSVIQKIFFFSGSVQSILIKDIRFVQLSTSILFGTIKIEMIGYVENPPPINFLSKKDAVKLHNIITGLLVTKAENIDLDELSRKNVVKAVKKIGSLHQNIDS